MDLREAIAKAKSELGAELKSWERPSARLLPVDPAHAASCLKFALRYQHVGIAQAAAKTLGLFAPHLLWNGLLKYAASETASLDLTPTLAVMAAKKDQAWLRRKGGRSRVAAYLVDLLLRTPRSMDARNLWRLSFDDPEIVSADFKEVVKRARAILRAMPGLLGHQATNADDAWRVFEAVSDTDASTLAVDVYVAVFRQVLAAPILMQPLIRHLSGESAGWSTCSQFDQHIGNVPKPRSAQTWLSMTLTSETSPGRRAIDEIILALSELADALVGFGLNVEGRIEIIGALLERMDEDAFPAGSSQIKGLRKASRWSGVGEIGPEEAKIIDGILRANGSAVAKIRTTHIPSSLLDIA